MSGVSEKENVLNAKKVYIENLKWACDEFDKHNINLLIEPINQRNIPNYFLSSTDQAIEIIDKIERDNIYLLFDIYHHQIIRGDVSKYFEKFQAYIGHIQIAGIPNRNEPDQSELDYKYVFKLIERLNYTGFIGCEYNPLKDTVSGLKWRESLL
jgi:hydroxypyruvate isomerase|tara:strand:+ start:361 stop:822 length:462 start_codon:yes stop_codon:yes gene_type:complete